jgi:hypothetical protein
MEVRYQVMESLPLRVEPSLLVAMAETVIGGGVMAPWKVSTDYPPTGRGRKCLEQLLRNEM